jgi:hypothetical protein
MKFRIILTCLFLLALLGMNVLADTVLFPIRAMDVGVGQLEDDYTPFAEVQTFNTSRRVFTEIVVWTISVLLTLTWYKPVRNLIGGK